MTRVSPRIAQIYNVRREISQPADLTTLLLAQLVYEPPQRRTAEIKTFESRFYNGKLEGISGKNAAAFTRWLYQYLVINDTIRGISFYPIHPALSLSTNGEGTRVQGFIEVLVKSFTLAERTQLIESLWSFDKMPAFEKMIYDLIEWQIPEQGIAEPADTSRFHPDNGLLPGNKSSLTAGEAVLRQTKEDLLALGQAGMGVQSFVSHSGRLLSFALTRYLLAQAELSLELPIYAAPAADTHDGVKTLAHEIIEIHRARFAGILERQFRQAVNEVMVELNWAEDPTSETDARELVKTIFHPVANVIPPGHYQDLRQDFGSFTNIAYDYYWARGRGRFLRQLHATHLNMAKKAGIANSRSRYSQWHFYWLAPALIETLLLVTQARTREPRILMANLLEDWYQRYGLAVQINRHWQDIYQHDFRSLGSPEALNEANERRFTEILAERGRLHKNSDDFPWIILRD